jgi:hypothetical protein
VTEFEPLPVLRDLTDRERELIAATRRGDVLVRSELSIVPSAGWNSTGSRSTEM